MALLVQVERGEAAPLAGITYGPDVDKQPIPDAKQPSWLGGGNLLGKVDEFV
jgi:hypothetical protein